MRRHRKTTIPRTWAQVFPGRAVHPANKLERSAFPSVRDSYEHVVQTVRTLKGALTKGHPHKGARAIESGLVSSSSPAWRVERRAICPCGRPAPENKDSVALAFRWDDGSIGYFAPCSDPKCKGAESCREAIARLKKWRDGQTGGIGIHRRDDLGREYIARHPEREIRYNRRLTARRTSPDEMMILLRDNPGFDEFHVNPPKSR